MTVTLGINPLHITKLNFDQLCMLAATVMCFPCYLRDGEIRPMAKKLGLYWMERKRVEELILVYSRPIGMG